WSNRTCSTQRRVDRHRQHNDHLVLDNDLKEVRLQRFFFFFSLSSPFSFSFRLVLCAAID
ncbi:hypothetical protein M9458_009586, partial [Cirrhinus mrigala]